MAAQHQNKSETWWWRPSAEAPTAEITQYADDEDCEDEEITETRHILVWICAATKAPPTGPSPKRPPFNWTPPLDSGIQLAVHPR